MRKTNSDDWDLVVTNPSPAYAQVECDDTIDLGTRRNTYRETPSSSLTHSRCKQYPFLFGSQVPHIYQYAIPSNVTMTLPIECDLMKKETCEKMNQQTKKKRSKQHTQYGSFS